MDFPCSHLLKREWWAYPLDILTMGGYRLHKTHEYTNCLFNTKQEDYERVIAGRKEGTEGRKV
jgi:hypothetical protein